MCIRDRYTPFEKAVISRVNGTFGFAKLMEKEGEVFLPGKYLLGAMPGDVVLVKLEPTERSSDAGRVISVISENDTGFIGVFHLSLIHISMCLKAPKSWQNNV